MCGRELQRQMLRFGQRTPTDRGVDQREALRRRLERRDAILVVGPFDLGAHIEALAVRLDAAEDAQRRDARDIGTVVDLRAGHVGGDVGADVEAADLCERCGALKLEAPDARLVLPERSEEHTSELQSLMRSSYAVFCLKK